MSLSLSVLQVMRRCRLSSPGMTKSSDRPSSGRHWFFFFFIIMMIINNNDIMYVTLTHGISLPAGLCNPPGPTVGHRGDHWSLHLLVNDSPSAHVFIFCILFHFQFSLLMFQQLIEPSVCVHSAPVRFYIQTHPHLYMAS